MIIFVANFGPEMRNPEAFRSLEPAKKFVEDKHPENKGVWHFLEDDANWYFTPDAEDDTPEEAWSIMEVELWY